MSDAPPLAPPVAAPGPVTARNSRTNLVLTQAAFTALILGMALVNLRNGDHDMSPWILPGLAVLLAVLAVPRFLDRAPRLVLDASGLAWRGRRGQPMNFLPWSEIVRAEIRPSTEDEPLTLRLTLPPRPALESVASERAEHRVDIEIDNLDLHQRRLGRLIHQFAPHLMTRFAG